ncbi:YbaB/EbfC family nucleoid-associated protein [Mesomycoplasma moatsii]|uniref:YbaB/EbfC family nucleoid-associated protein n=1 Tax=Mesomycoplasma moatsii TaxID=171287 RepID=UPI0003B5392C
MDINKLMQQANKMKAEMEKKEKEFESKVFIYEKQGVKLIIEGSLQIKSIEIDEALVDPDDKETLQDMIIITVNEATKDILEQKKRIGDSITKGMF